MGAVRKSEDGGLAADGDVTCRVSSERLGMTEVAEDESTVQITSASMTMAEDGTVIVFEGTAHASHHDLRDLHGETIRLSRLTGRLEAIGGETPARLILQEERRQLQARAKRIVLDQAGGEVHLDGKVALESIAEGFDLKAEQAVVTLKADGRTAKRFRAWGGVVRTVYAGRTVDSDEVVYDVLTGVAVFRSGATLISVTDAQGGSYQTDILTLERDSDSIYLGSDSVDSIARVVVRDEGRAP